MTDRERLANELDVFLAAYSRHSDSEALVGVIDPTDDLLTLGTLRGILAALREPTPALGCEAVLEAAARVAESYDLGGLLGDDLPKGWRGCRRQIAAAIRALKTTPAPAVSTDEIVAALFKSQSFSAGHGPVGEFVTLNFPNRADREAFLEAYIAALKSKPAILSRIRGEGE